MTNQYTSARAFEVAGFDEAQELYHRKGWTDGLPIVPPTPERVAQFLATAGLKPDEQIGFYAERRIPVFAEQLAINAVMAGCLPEYLPVVVAIVDALLEPSFRTHVVNSSTGSFTLGFIVNGPIRNQLGMNAHGNVLGPGNRANSSIGRAIRLIQLNVLGSIPGAGGPEPEHGRAVLDRSMMGQPAKYAGYHIVENEEAFPSLTPLHVELGFAPEDSTVTLLFVAGYEWICAHAEQTPDAWCDTMAHYVVQSGHLQRDGYAVLLLPPENAGLFTRNGWTKQDIRNALYERTKRSVAWVKQEGWKVQWQQPRLEPVKPGDEETMLAMAGSARPEDLIIVVCGGPAGSWPYYLHGGGGLKAITRKIGNAGAARPVPAAIEQALASQRAMLAADGYGLALAQDASGAIVATISAGADACPDCLVPESLMRTYFERALGSVGEPGLPEIRLVYPVA
jgi:hypothetical protein